jgi:hypothetical protein
MLIDYLHEHYKDMNRTAILSSHVRANRTILDHVIDKFYLLPDAQRTIMKRAL